ncbi:MAG: molybdopterin molybdenumtransferase MoeA, partial [Rhodobacteraceae bacterium]|nr:molybdopterin molybdenumtransferase MoeA [Paracoccaceae bacterium]
MSGFERILVVDWSGADDRGPAPKKDAIWAALAPVTGGVAPPPVYLRSRAAAEDWLAATLAAEVAAGRRVLAGFDFPFGFPAGFAAAVVGAPDPLALWNWLAARLPPAGGDRFAVAAALNARFPGTGPFWFNATRRDHPGLPRRGRARQGHGLPERRLAETRARGAFPVWQLGGAGAAGSQALTGMAALARLRARLGEAVRVWPFEATDAPVVLAEVWPALIRAEIAAARRAGEIADAAQVRVLAAALARLAGDGGLAAALDAAPREARREEGWILGLGAEAALRAAARAATAGEAAA